MLYCKKQYGKRSIASTIVHIKEQKSIPVATLKQ